MADSNDGDEFFLRIGFLGVAEIGYKNAVAILPNSVSSRCLLTAIASRSREKAEKFRDEFLMRREGCGQLAKDIVICDSYDELLSNSSVDAVYIPVPTCYHKEWVVRALRAKKHVLVEKPVAIRCDEYDEMLLVAKEERKYILDGTMYAHHPRTDDFVRQCHAALFRHKSDSGKETTTTWRKPYLRMDASFTFCGDDDFFENNIRVQEGSDPLGCIGDVGWYPLRMALLLFFYSNETASKTATAEVRAIDYKCNESGVPIDATCFVKFEDTGSRSGRINKVVGAFHCGFATAFQQNVRVVGCGSDANGWLEMNDFVLPKPNPISFAKHAQEVGDHGITTDHTSETSGDYTDDAQQVLMWTNFAKYCRSIDLRGWDNGDGDDEELKKAYTHSRISFYNQKILDAIMESIRSDGAKISINFC